MYLLNVTIMRQKSVSCVSHGGMMTRFMVILSLNIQNLCSP
ncbi:hypothetical protein [Escherichia phage vB_EcoM_TU01]|nr:hypothetical protein [Escherichia phage vB_EcoM_TU01]